MVANVKTAILFVGFAVLVALAVLLGGIVLSRPETGTTDSRAQATHAPKRGDQELAYLLVKLELETRAAIAEHYTRVQSSVPGVDFVYKRWLAKNLILPAAVADRVFSKVVPAVTGDRAWGKMVVQNPRNPHNRGDAVALELLHVVQEGKQSVERSAPEGYYYAEPIKATRTCLPCHGEPRGEPDPLFPQFKKNGWRDGDIIGAVVARVRPTE